MPKVIKLDFDDVVVANDDGSILRTNYDSFNFKPEIGDLLEIYDTGEELIIHKLETKSVSQDIQDKININIINDNTQNQNNQQNNAGVYVQSGKVVNKVLYVVLALILGGVGGHKFYTGKIMSGVIYLLFCWTYIPALLGLFTGVAAAFKRPDANGNIVV